MDAGRCAGGEEVQVSDTDAAQNDADSSMGTAVVIDIPDGAQSLHSCNAAWHFQWLVLAMELPGTSLA